MYYGIQRHSCEWLYAGKKKICAGKSVTEYYKFSDDLPSISEIQRLVAGYPNEDKLIEIIARSYDYIQKLPLKGISEDYDQITDP
jgi:hypothetical protein